MTNVSSIRPRVRDYAEEEPWKKDHKDAMACVNLERFVAYGIWLFYELHRHEETWRASVARGVIPYSEDAQKEMVELVQLWLKPCECIEQGIQYFTKLGYDVSPAAKFREVCAEARWTLAAPETAFDHEKMIALRDEAVDAHRKGDTTDMDDRGD